MLEYKDREPRARVIFREAYNAQIAGNLDLADKYYRYSIGLYPTAQGFQFYGWCRSFRGEFDEAINLCKRAIEIDNRRGGPYNDIGAYLIAKGNTDEAIPFLKRALRWWRKNNFPEMAFFNLGLIYEKKGNMAKAKKFYATALKRNPKYHIAKDAILKLNSL